jgi:hypothetical protein
METQWSLQSSKCHKDGTVAKKSQGLDDTTQKTNIKTN